METYRVLTCIILTTFRDPKLERQFTRIIEVPFLPYQMEGKVFNLYFKSDKNSVGNHRLCRVKYVHWNCNETAEGEWRMCIITKATKDDFKWIADLIEKDCLVERPSV